MPKALLKIVIIAASSLLLTLPVTTSAVTLTNISVPATPLANLYELHAKGLHITYSTSGLDGKPHLSYQNRKKTLNFTGDEIRTVGTEIGTLVSVSIVKTVDTGSTSFSLLLPAVNLDEITLQAPIKIQGIVTEHKFSMIPTFNKGQRDNYKFVPLDGKAKFVNF